MRPGGTAAEGPIARRHRHSPSGLRPAPRRRPPAIRQGALVVLVAASTSRWILCTSYQRGPTVQGSYEPERRSFIGEGEMGARSTAALSRKCREIRAAGYAWARCCREMDSVNSRPHRNGCHQALRDGPHLAPPTPSPRISGFRPQGLRAPGSTQTGPVAFLASHQAEPEAGGSSRTSLAGDAVANRRT